ncbi:TonB-dependent receptor [Daejeonella oryzae]|uniref:TonB-dependent receptor n=1 Tax=Daejeonella oryzae TaxID=1122943 RepID=UPI0009DBA154|nr:TonB-dependent receptor [Daejeonella oryzae]
MKYNVIIRILAISVFFTLITLNIFGQETGKIAGKVTDKKTGETLIGLTVKVEGTTKGVMTDVDGNYNLGGLTPGKVALTFSYIGYKSKSITDIQVNPGVTTSLDIVMEEAGGQVLSEVVITATARQESLNGLYAKQKNSVRVTDGISAETIKKSPDKNTSEVLKRVSGTTIQDNKFVVVRGLADRYNSASLDNGVLPSTEPNRKAFSFDIVPSNLIDNIIISKTATPDLAGDFAGGSVQIITKDIPDDNFMSFGLGYSYNSQATFQNFQSGARNTSDYFGFDNGLRSIPNNFPSTRKIINNGVGPNKNIASLQALPQDYGIRNGNAFLNQNYQFTVGRVKDFEKTNNRLGAILSLTYRNSQNSNTGIVRQYHVFDYSDDQYKFSTNVGALANFAYNFKNSRITLKNLYNRTLDDQYTYRTGNNKTTGDVKFYAFDLLQKSLFKTALEGEHKVGDNNSKLKWTLGFGNVINDQPDQRKVNYLRNVADRDVPNSYYAGVTNIGKENARLFSYLNENVYSAEAGYSLPLKFFKNSANFKAGISSNYRNRNFDVRFLGLRLQTDANNPQADNEIRQRPIETLFGEDLISQGKYKLDEVNNNGDSYDANSLVNAAYVMMDNKIGAKSRIVYGVRMEQYDLKLKTLTTNNLVSQNFADILPSVNYTYSISEKSNFRASYFKTLARPEFRELAPFTYFDYERGANVQGNPLLKRAKIDNADLRYEFFPSAGQIFSVSTFYKKFTNAIEASIADANSTPDISYFNSKKADVYGVELEYRKNLAFLGTNEAFKNTTFYTNLSLIKSKVKNPEIDNIIEKERPLVGQSPYVINAGLQHTALNNLLNFNLLYNRIGRRIANAGGQQFPSVYEAPRNVVDFQLGYKILKSKGELKFNANDILNNDNVLYFDKDMNKKYSIGSSDETISRFKTGSNYSLSFNYSF